MDGRKPFASMLTKVSVLIDIACGSCQAVVEGGGQNFGKWKKQHTLPKVPRTIGLSPEQTGSKVSVLSVNVAVKFNLISL